jgi:lysine-specific permease
MQFWLPEFPSWIWIAIVLSLLFLTNAIGVRSFGNTEYYLSGLLILNSLIV